MKPCYGGGGRHAHIWQPQTTHIVYTPIHILERSYTLMARGHNESIRADKIHTSMSLSLQALDGQAFDRHLLGLRTLARESGMDMPDIFTDPSYGETLQFRLSTSQVCI